MPSAEIISITAATQLVRRIVDDVYNSVSTSAGNRWHANRADLNDSSIAKAVIAATKTKTLLHYKDPISVYEFYYPARILYARGSMEILSLKDFNGQNIVLHGIAGQGKSLLLRYLCGQELKDTYSSGKIPFFIELRRLRSDLTLIDLILETLGKFKLPKSESFWKQLAASGKVVLLLDGFDEVDQALVSRCLSDIEEVVDLYDGRVQTIVTSRPDSDICYSTKFTSLKLAFLRPENHLHFLIRLCKDKYQASNLVQVIEESSTDIQGLLITPLMMTLLVLLYQSLQTIPDTLPKFYEELFDVLFYRHDQFKPGFRRKRLTNLDDSIIKDLFAALCFHVRLGNLSSLSSFQLSQNIQKACIVCNQSVDPDRFRDELTKTVCLILQDGLEFSFVHKSVTQYYAASFIRRSSDEFARGFYQKTLLNGSGDKWDLELRFLKEIDSYRYMKWREAPLLRKAASSISYAFDKPTDKMAKNLMKHILPRIEFIVTTRLHVYRIAKRTLDRRSFDISIARPTKSDELMTALGDFLIAGILSEIDKPSFCQEIISGIERKHGKHFPDRVIVSGMSLEEQLRPTLLSLFREGLSQLKARYSNAESRVAAEESKNDLLALLKTTSGSDSRNYFY